MYAAQRSPNIPYRPYDSYQGERMQNAQGPHSATSPAQTNQSLPGIGMTMEEMLAMFQQLMAQQQGSANPVGVGPSSKAPLDPPSYTPPMQAPGRLAPPASSPISPLTPTTPSYMDSPPPPPKVGNQSVPGMPAPQLSAITEMMKNTQGQAGMPPPRVQGSSPSVGQAFGPRKSRR